MKKLFFLLILLVVLILACEQENELTISEKFNSYYFGYMHYPLSVRENPETDNLVKLEYSGDKVVKRTGGLVPVSPTTGYSYAFSDLIYDLVAHGDDKITLVSYYESNGYITATYESVFLLNSQNKIIQQVVTDLSTNLVDTIHFIYAPNGLLNKSIKQEQFNAFTLNETALFYFNANNNLDSIITEVQYQDDILEKRVEIFSNYDNSANPLKKLAIFNETFLRSLSANNYSKYNLYKYNQDNVLIEEKERFWSFSYNIDGDIDFDAH